MSRKKLSIVILLTIINIILCGCSTKKSIVGKWRLINGSDIWIIEFTELGEFIEYDGIRDIQHGSYTYNDKQIDLIRYGGLHNINNYSWNRDNLIIITSNGMQEFEKISDDEPIREFDEQEIKRIYSDKDYDRLETHLYTNNGTSLVYHTTISKSYKYMNESIVMEDHFEYSKLGAYWYHTKTSQIDHTENWHLNGLWKRIKDDESVSWADYDNDYVNITYFDGKKVELSYYAHTEYGFYESGTYDVEVEKAWIASPDDLFLNFHNSLTLGYGAYLYFNKNTGIKDSYSAFFQSSSTTQLPHSTTDLGAANTVEVVEEVATEAVAVEGAEEVIEECHDWLLSWEGINYSSENFAAPISDFIVGDTVYFHARIYGGSQPGDHIQLECEINVNGKLDYRSSFKGVSYNGNEIWVRKYLSTAGTTDLKIYYTNDAGRRIYLDSVSIVVYSK